MLLILFCWYLHWKVLWLMKCQDGQGLGSSDQISQNNAKYFCLQWWILIPNVLLKHSFTATYVCGYVIFELYISDVPRQCSSSCSGYISTEKSYDWSSVKMVKGWYQISNKHRCILIPSVILKCSISCNLLSG